jgi:hypothetical protein
MGARRKTDTSVIGLSGGHQFFLGADLRATKHERARTPAGRQTHCCRAGSRLALPERIELAPYRPQILAVRTAGQVTLPSNRRLVGSGTPLRGAQPPDALFRWSFPLCPERPPATLCQPSGLDYASIGRMSTLQGALGQPALECGHSGSGNPKGLPNGSRTSPRVSWGRRPPGSGEGGVLHPGGVPDSLLPRRIEIGVAPEN